MTEKVELKIYGGKFQFVPAEMRYAAYQATLARTLESFNDRWLEHAMRRLLSESCKDVWNEEFWKFQDSVRRAFSRMATFLRRRRRMPLHLCAFEEADLKKVAETFAAFKRSK